MEKVNRKDVGEHSSKYVTILHISDIFENDYEVFDTLEADLLIFTGNYARMVEDNYKEKLKDLNNFIAKINCKHKLYVCGNEEEYLGQLQNEELQSLLPNCILLHEKLFEYKGIRIYGLPHMDFGPFSVSDETMIEKLNDIPDNTDILVTHVPPQSILDLNMGHSALLNFFKQQIKPNIKLHCFGHISGETGFVSYNCVVFSNASMKIKKTPHLIKFYLPENSNDQHEFTMNEEPNIINNNNEDINIMNNNLINNEVDLSDIPELNQYISWEKKRLFSFN